MVQKGKVIGYTWHAGTFSFAVIHEQPCSADAKPNRFYSHYASHTFPNFRKLIKLAISSHISTTQLGFLPRKIIVLIEGSTYVQFQPILVQFFESTWGNHLSKIIVGCGE